MGSLRDIHHQREEIEVNTSQPPEPPKTCFGEFDKHYKTGICDACKDSDECGTKSILRKCDEISKEHTQTVQEVGDRLCKKMDDLSQEIKKGLF
jgi:hypothetical protein